MEDTDNRIMDRILNDAREEAQTIVKNAQNYAKEIIEKEKLSATKNAEKEATKLLKKPKTMQP